MELSLRPYATAGIALVGASVIAVTPVTVSPDSHLMSADVALSAAVDPITPILTTFDSAEVNFAHLADEWLQAPLPIAQQVIANQLANLSTHPDLGTALGNIGDNVKAALDAVFAKDLSTLEPGHEFIYPVLTEGLDALGLPALLPKELQPVLDLTTTYLSGALIGLVGPVVAPMLALAAGTQAIVDNLTGATPDLASAVNDLVNVPAAMTDAFLNGGQKLDLTPVVSALAPALGLDLPEGTTLGVTLGGLLSPGGSLFNSLNLGIDVSGIPISSIGQPVGTLGSLMGLSKTIAKALGWDGSGNPLAPKDVTTKTDATKKLDAGTDAAVTADVAAPATVPSLVRGAKVMSLRLDQKPVEQKRHLRGAFGKTTEADATVAAPSATPAADTEQKTDTPKKDSTPRVKRHWSFGKKSADSTGKRSHSTPAKHTAKHRQNGPQKSHQKSHGGKHSAK